MLVARLGGEAAPESRKTLSMLRAKDTNRAVAREQARLLRENSKLSVLANLANCAVLSAACISAGLPYQAVLAWAGLLVLAVGYRIWIMKRYPAIGDDSGRLVRWLRHYVASSGGLGCVWGTTAVAFYLAESPWVATLIVFVIAGMSAGAAATNGVYPRAAGAFLVSVLLPFILYFLMSAVTSTGSSVGWAMVPLTLVYFGVLVRVAKNLEASIKETVALREQKTGMARQLENSLNEAQRTQQELVASKSRYEMIAENSVAWESLFREDGTLLLVNAAVEWMTGYSITECRLMSEYPLPVVHDDDRDRVKAALAAARNDMSRQSLSFRFVRKDGHVRSGAMVFTPVNDESGQGAGFLATVFDVTEDAFPSRGQPAGQWAGAK